MTAHHFLITRLDTGLLVGHALLCLAARYAGVRWKGTDQLHRRFAGPAMWRAIDRDLRVGWDAGLVEPGSATFGLLITTEETRALVSVQKFVDVLLDLSSPALACERYLRQQTWLWQRREP